MNLEQTTMKKVAWRLMPYLCLLFFVAFIDRVNVGFAALHMNADLGLSATAFGTGAGMFFIGYFFFEVPSNMLLKRFGIRFTIARIMIAWGLISASFALVQNETQFYVLRFLLGVAEAGFLPGIIYYFTLWLPAGYRGRLIAVFVMMIPASTVIGAPLSTWIMTAMEGVMGYRGWQWMFVIEALPAILLGFSVYRMLPESPAMAPWLNDAEKGWLIGRLEHEGAVKAEHLPAGWWKAVANLRVIKITIVYASICFGIYGVGFWIAQIIKGFGQSDQTTGFITAIPYLLASVCMIFWGRHSDYKKERVWHVALPAWFSAIAFVAAYLTLSMPVLAVCALSCCIIGIFCALPPYWTYPTLFFSGSAAAIGIAVVNSIGNLAGYFGPTLVGILKDTTGDFASGMLLLGAVMLICGIAALSLRKDFRLEAMARSEREEEPNKAAPLSAVFQATKA